MKIKNFTAKSYKEALDLVKKEFGPDAVILETEELKGDERLVKITAAIDFEDVAKTNTNTAPLDGFDNYLEDALLVDRDFPTYSEDLKEEIREIKKILLEMKNDRSLLKGGVFDYLRKQGIREEFLDGLIEGDEDQAKVVEKLSSEIRAGYRLSNGKTIMLVGPTGAGKTTTIVKLAAFAVKIGKKVGIMNLDSFRLGAFEQMRVFCQLLGIPFCSLNDVEELSDIYPDFSKDKDIIFIDTTGRNPKDKKYIAEINKVKEKGIAVETHLTVSLSMEDEIFIRAKENYESMGIDYIIFTKLDEAYRYGSIYNIYKTFNKPVAYLTNGQKIPYDIQAVNSAKITNIILSRGLTQ